MYTTDIYGYGAKIDTTDDAIVTFVKAHEETIMESTGRFMAERFDDPNYIVKAYNKILEAANKKESVKEALSNYWCYHSTGKDDEGIYGIVADIMWLETEIRFSCHHRHFIEGLIEAEAGEDWIMLDEYAPWEYNDIERNISQNDFNAIMIKYFAELGIKLESSDIDFDTITYPIDD